MNRLILVGLGCCLALALPMPAWGAADYDGDGFIADDCAPLDAAAHPGANDVPDVALEDLDCDGIDGTAAGAFFVSTAGSNAGDGSMFSRTGSPVDRPPASGFRRSAPTIW